VSAQRYEIEAWVGDPALYDSPEQHAEVVEAIIASGSGSEADWLAIMERVTGALDLAERMGAVRVARAAFDEARERLIASVRQAVAGGMSESEAARQCGVTRMTIRSWLGKS
jgi:hypothetical protein